MNKQWKSLAWCLSIFVLVACGDDDQTQCTTDRNCNLGEECIDSLCVVNRRDAGRADLGVADSRVDTDSTDVGTMDTGPVDGGPDMSMPGCETDCDDGLECTNDFCAAGTCVNQPAPNGQDCSSGVCEEASSSCVGCVDNSHCSGLTPTCNPLTNECVACASNADCNDDNDCTHDICDASACSNPPIAAGEDCAAGVCDGASTCVACVTDGDCSGARCELTEHVCVNCLEDTDCLGSDRCDTSTYMCAACLGAADCTDANPCTADTCSDGVCANRPKATGSGCPAGVCRQDTVMCVECVSNAECSGATPTCNTTTNRCVSCLSAGDCDDRNDCTRDACDGGRCLNRALSAGDACTGGVCNGAATLCVECVSNDDCTSGSRPFCNTTSDTCAMCLSDRDCSGAGATCNEGVCAACVGPTCPGVPAHLWATTIDGGTGFEQGRAIATDGSGNVYVAGPFNGTLTLTLPGGGVGSFTSRGGTDSFLFKFNSSGVLQWAKTFGSPSNDGARGVSTDAAGNVYITGAYQGTGVHIDAGPELPYVDGDTKNFYVASLTSDGTHRWSRGFTGTGKSSGNSIVVSGDHVFAVGFFFNTIAIGATDETAGPNVETTSDGTPDIMVMNLHASNGSLRWHRAYGSAGSDIAWGATATDNDKVYLTGVFTGNVDFGSAGVATASGDRDLFVLKINSAGLERRLATFGGAGAETVGRAIDVGTSRGVVISGKFTGSVRFIGAVETSRTGEDGLVMALDSNLVPQWYETFGGGAAGRTNVLGVAVGDGQVYVTGLFDNSVQIGSETLMSGGADDVFVASLALADGTVYWAEGFGSTVQDRGWGVAASVGRVYATGYVSGPTNFGSGVVPQAPTETSS